MAERCRHCGDALTDDDGRSAWVSSEGSECCPEMMGGPHELDCRPDPAGEVLAELRRALWRAVELAGAPEVHGAIEQAWEQMADAEAARSSERWELV